MQTDHRPLTWLFNVKDPGSRLVRWRLKFEEFEYEIRYKKGCENVVADELSRNVRMMQEEEVGSDNRKGNSQEIESFEEVDQIIDDTVNSMMEDNVVVPSIEVELEEEQIDGLHPSEPGEEEGNENNVCKEITDLEERKRIIRENHYGLLGGHTGQKATYAKLRVKYHWKGMQRDVEEYIRNCKHCQTEKVTRQIKMNPMKIVTSAERALEKISMDLIGPLKQTKDGHKFGLTIQDDLSKFIKFIPLKDKAMETVARAITNDWILNFGLPKIILTDNGMEFCNALFEEFCKIFEMQHITTSIAHPQANGGVERAHCRLLEYLKATGKELNNMEDWHERMPYASFCYNTTVHTTTGYTPYELVYGNLANKPSELDDNYEKSTFDYLDELKANLLNKSVIARNRTLNAKQKAKFRYDKHIGKPVEYKIGQQVLVKNLVKGKLESKFKGPFKISKVYQDHVFIKLGNKEQKHNKSNIRPYFTGSPGPSGQQPGTSK